MVQENTTLGVNSYLTRHGGWNSMLVFPKLALLSLEKPPSMLLFNCRFNATCWFSWYLLPATAIEQSSLIMWHMLFIRASQKSTNFKMKHLYFTLRSEPYGAYFPRSSHTNEFSKHTQILEFNSTLFKLPEAGFLPRSPWWETGTCAGSKTFSMK